MHEPGSKADSSSLTTLDSESSGDDALVDNPAEDRESVARFRGPIRRELPGRAETWLRFLDTSLPAELLFGPRGLDA